MSKTITISDETYDLIKNQLQDGEEMPLDIDALQDLVGQNWFFRTVTNYLLGKVKKQIGGFLVLEQATWIADTKRFADFLNGKTENAEVEPVGECLLNISSIVDAFPWRHPLLKKQQ